MAGGGGNSTAICPPAAVLKRCSTQLTRCAGFGLAFKGSMLAEILEVNTLLLADVILATIIVGIGAYGQRFRHHPLTRPIYRGASTLFLVIITSMPFIGVDSFFSVTGYFGVGKSLTASCQIDPFQSFVVVTWAFLVQIALVNTSEAVAADGRERLKIAPRIELLADGVWTVYLGFRGFTGINKRKFLQQERLYLLNIIPFLLICAKIVLQYYAFTKARRSFALGRNPRLVYGYMQQLRQQEEEESRQRRQQEESHQHEGEPQVGEYSGPPRLLVMGEDGREVDKQPEGYVFSHYHPAEPSAVAGLVTLDSVWQLPEYSNTSQKQKDLCMSFALFKLLRCRFARYNLTKISSTRTLHFFRNLLMKEGDEAAERVFQVVTDELSFVRDYYYLSFPISYSKFWLPILSVSLSLLSIGYCIVVMTMIMGKLILNPGNKLGHQMDCKFWCSEGFLIGREQRQTFGSLYFAYVPVIFLLAVVVISEVRDIASYICSNWTKVALICRHVNRASGSLQHPSPHLRMPKWVALVLQLRCGYLMNHWNGKMGQCSVLVLPPSRQSLLHRLLDSWRTVKVPAAAAVKVCIVDALRSSSSNGWLLTKGTESLRRNDVHENFGSACEGKGSSDVILTWHIATCILEVRYPPPLETTSSKHRIAATHLSRYCMYLVTWFPKLLPDDDAWTKSLRKAVKKGAERAGHGVAAGLAPQDKYKKVVQLLSEASNHEVLKNGATLGQKLVEQQDEETAWKVLAGFWSEMILYVAPSYNRRGHLQAIAQGGELVTLVWALLNHAGIVQMPS